MRVGDPLKSSHTTAAQSFKSAPCQWPLSVRALAAILERDYKNVHSDVKILEDSGLIMRDNKKHILNPYEKLTIELPLTA